MQLAFDYALCKESRAVGIVRAGECISMSV